MSEITDVLQAVEQGSTRAVPQLFTLVYDELRRIAALKMAQEKPGQTLQATALVHEAYVRIVGAPNAGEAAAASASSAPGVFANRAHFMAAAAEAMRRILVESARRKQRHKHGGKMQRQELDDEVLAIEPPSGDFLAVDEALDELARNDSQTAELVKLHYFAGLTMDEAAAVLGISPRSAYRSWAYAKAWLFRKLSDPTAGPR